MAATDTSADAFVSSAAKMKSSLSSLGFSFLFLHDSDEEGRRWVATGETRNRFKTGEGIRFSGQELTKQEGDEVEVSSSENGLAKAVEEDDSALRDEVTGVVKRLLGAVEAKEEGRGEAGDSSASSSQLLAASDEKLKCSTSKSPRDFAKLLRWVEDVCEMQGGDAFLLIESENDVDKRFWYATGELRQLALKGESQRGMMEEEEEVEEEEGVTHQKVDNAGKAKDVSAAKAADHVSGKENAASAMPAVDDAGAESDDSEIEIIGTVDAPPSPPRQRRSSSSSSSLSHSSSADQSTDHCQYFTARPSKTKSPRKGTDKAKTVQNGDELQIDEDAKSALGQKRKSSLVANSEGNEPLEKKKRVNLENNGPLQKVVDGEEETPTAEEKEGKSEDEDADAADGDGDAKEGNSDLNGERGTENAKNDKDDNDDAMSSDGSDIEVIGTVAAPPRRRSRSSSRSSSRSRSYSRSRSRSPRSPHSPRSPRGSRSPSPLFTRDFLYSGAPRVSIPNGDDDSDVEDVTEEAAAEERLYDEEVFQDNEGDEEKEETEGMEETEGKEGNENTAAGEKEEGRPPPDKDDIECIDLDDED